MAHFLRQNHQRTEQIESDCVRCQATCLHLPHINPTQAVVGAVIKYLRKPSISVYREKYSMPVVEIMVQPGGRASIHSRHTDGSLATQHDMSHAGTIYSITSYVATVMQSAYIKDVQAGRSLLR